jgi:soluble lytic murein transglycosylase-like protein
MTIAEVKKLVRILCAGAGLFILATGAQARDNAVLRSGFSISHDHRQVLGATTRLFLNESEREFVDISSTEIEHFEIDDTPVPPSRSEPSIGAKRSPDLNEIVATAARNNQLDADFVHSVIRAESNGNSRAVSRKGALGLMQLMPKTATALGVKNSLDASENVGAGSRYLRELLARYHNDPVRALAAYNAGAGRVNQYGGVPPYRETRAYIAAIIRDFNRRKADAARAALSGKKLADNNPAKGSSPSQSSDGN